VVARARAVLAVAGRPGDEALLDEAQRAARMLPTALRERLAPSCGSEQGRGACPNGRTLQPKLILASRLARESALASASSSPMRPCL
jgi:hypothetical protein